MGTARQKIRRPADTGGDHGPACGQRLDQRDRCSFVEGTVTTTSRSAQHARHVALPAEEGDRLREAEPLALPSRLRPRSSPSPTIAKRTSGRRCPIRAAAAENVGTSLIGTRRPHQAHQGCRTRKPGFPPQDASRQGLPPEVTAPVQRNHPDPASGRDTVSHQIALSRPRTRQRAASSSGRRRAPGNESAVFAGPKLAVQHVAVERVHDDGPPPRAAATRPTKPAFAVCVWTMCGRTRASAASAARRRRRPTWGGSRGPARASFSTRTPLGHGQVQEVALARRLLSTTRRVSYPRGARPSLSRMTCSDGPPMFSREKRRRTRTVASASGGFTRLRPSASRRVSLP